MVPNNSTQARRSTLRYQTRFLLVFIFSPIATSTPAADDDPARRFDVRQFGAKGDGATDNTAAFQLALDAAGKTPGSIVDVPRGNYLFAGHINVPTGVTLAGTWQSVPAHNGIRDRGLPKPTDDGTTFLVTDGENQEASPAFLTLNTNSVLRGVVIYYPRQKVDEVPKPYPWTIAMRGKNPTVLDVELLNPFNAIDATRNERHMIRNVHGQPLRRGIWVDAIYDIGRIENVHFNPWWSGNKTALKWQIEHGEAFIFGKSDWQYVLNTFCFGYKVGYKFVKTNTGMCNGNFLGIGADACQTAVLVEECARYGLMITNGEFVAFKGDDPTMVKVAASNRGSVRFVNCAYWGPCHQIAKIAGKGTVGFGDCTFCRWDSKREGRHAIQAASGSVLVRGCEFQLDRPQVSLGKNVTRAIISNNLLNGPERIDNHSQGVVRIANNVGLPVMSSRHEASTE